ncbi:MAG: hypothetical protein IPK80_21305 [Nannocystis sp.]|jgi:hypothetical protein|nr:hypothetical protein [Nannocystis sp.]MBK8263860.1 hypothetical protein [Nannocystis sp.]
MSTHTLHDPVVDKTRHDTLSDQLRQSRADLHRLGIADQNRALIFAAISGAVGIAIGIGVGVSIRRK